MATRRSRFPGVSWVKKGRKWHAQIRINGRTKHLGSFKVEEDAARAYEAAAKERAALYASQPKGRGRSTYRGVSWNTSNNKWIAFIHEDGKQKHLGYFKVEKEAARAYDAAARLLLGDNATTNFKITT